MCCTCVQVLAEGERDLSLAQAIVLDSRLDDMLVYLADGSAAQGGTAPASLVAGMVEALAAVRWEGEGWGELLPPA